MTDTKAPEYSPEQVAEVVEGLTAITTEPAECWHPTHISRDDIRTILSALAKVEGERDEWKRTADAFADDVCGYINEILSLRSRLESAERPIPIDDWHEDDGPVLLWFFPVCEPPFAGTPNDSDWPGYHTHFTRLIVPHSSTPTQGGTNG